MQQARIVIDHVRGSRRGNRQEFPLGARVRFGRHPENEVAFHARRDLDASSRHAELVPGRDSGRESPGSGYLLRDTGSSNGTLVDGRPHAELALPRDTPVIVAFGASGPVVRIFIGAEPPAPVSVNALRRLWDRFQGAPRAWPIWVALALGLATLVAWVSLGMRHTR
jgi:FHA domain